MNWTITSTTRYPANCSACPNDATNAAEYFTKALAKDPKLVDAYYWRGISYVQQRKMAEAKADMQRVVELEPAGPTSDKAKKALEQLK